MHRLTVFLTRATIALLPLYLVRFHIGPIPSTLLEVLLLATITSWLVQKLISREPIQKLPRIFLVIATVFLLAATISIFTSPDIRAALGVWRAYFVEPLLFFLVTRDLLQKKRITKSTIIFPLALSAVALSIYAIVQKYTGWGIPHPWNLERRVTSIFPYPNALALYLAPLVPLFIIQAIEQRKKIICAISYGAVALLSLVAIVFAQSTGALIGLCAGLTVLAGLWLIKTKHWKLLIVAMLVAVVAAAGILSMPSIRHELLLNDWSGRVHKTGWHEALTMLQSRPIFGAGLSGFPAAVKPYHKATYLEIFQYPHNIVLNFWSETGALGLLGFIALIVYYFYSLFSLRRKWTLHSLSLISAMVVILVHGLVDVPYFKNDLAVIFWLIYALGISDN